MTSTNSKSFLASLSGLLCFVLVAGGGSGLLREWFGWIHFMGFLRFLVPEGYEIYSYALMMAFGVAIGVAGKALAGRRGE